MPFASFTTAKTLARYPENTLPEQTFYQGAPGLAVVARPGTESKFIFCVLGVLCGYGFWIVFYNGIFVKMTLPPLLARI